MVLSLHSKRKQNLRNFFNRNGSYNSEMKYQIDTKYSKGKFYYAVCVLVGTGDLKDRLYRSYELLSALEQHHFSGDETARRFLNLQKLLTGQNTAHFLGNLEVTLQAMTTTEAVEIACEIYEISQDL